MSNHESNPTQLLFRHSRRGMTHVELMIVVAIIGVLAAIGLVSFTRYVEDGRITELKQYTMDVARGQEQYFSRHHHYLAIQDHATEYDSSQQAWTQLLEFSQDLPNGVSVYGEGSGEAGDGNTCSQVCPGGDPADEDDIWFAVCASHVDSDSDVYYDSTMEKPIEVDSSDCSF